MNNHSTSARDIIGSSPLIAIENEAPPKLIVDPPLSEPLSQGRVFIQYRTENLRVLPVFGKGALDVSPRIGHIHITVDDAPWHFVDTSGETIILVGLESGLHKVLIELADPKRCNGCPATPRAGRRLQSSTDQLWVCQCCSVHQRSY